MLGVSPGAWTRICVLPFGLGDDRRALALGGDRGCWRWHVRAAVAVVVPPVSSPIGHSSTATSTTSAAAGRGEDAPALDRRHRARRRADRARRAVGAAGRERGAAAARREPRSPSGIAGRSPLG